MRDSILLVGGNGFLGSHLATALADDFEIHTFDRPGSRHHGVGHFHPGEIDNASDLDSAMGCCSSMVYLVHETGLSPYLDSDRLTMVRNFELLLLTLESASRCGVRNIAFFSSGGAVYGVPEALPVHESHSLKPVSTYGVAKAAMELYLQSVARSGRFQILILRPSNPFGPGQNPLRKQGVVSVFARKILLGEPLEVWGDGRERKDYIYVEDMAEMVALLVKAGFDNNAYNVCSGKGLSLLDLISLLEAASGRKALIEFHPKKPGVVPEIILDPSKLQSRVGKTTTTPLHQAIEKTLEWIEKLI